MQNVPVQHVYASDPEVPWSPTNTKSFRLGDRVASLRSDLGVPFGTLGTIVGVHRKFVEVLTDRVVASGTTLHNRCNDNRGVLLPQTAVINLSDMREPKQSFQSSNETYQSNQYYYPNEQQYVSPNDNYYPNDRYYPNERYGSNDRYPSNDHYNHYQSGSYYQPNQYYQSNQYQQPQYYPNQYQQQYYQSSNSGNWSQSKNKDYYGGRQTYPYDYQGSDNNNKRGYDKREYR